MKCKIGAKKKKIGGARKNLSPIFNMEKFTRREQRLLERFIKNSFFLAINEFIDPQKSIDFIAVFF